MIPKPTSAAPGLSEHGRLKAIDFVILKGHVVIAKTNTEKEILDQQWETPGWTRKLKEAVTQSQSVLTGPLKSPYEPWHYTIPD